MTNFLLGAVVGILILGLGKIYNRIDDIGKLIELKDNNNFKTIIESLNNIEGSLFNIESRYDPSQDGFLDEG